MHKLTLDTFLAGPHDMELRRYRVLEGLKGHYEQFSHNRLYPDLAELIRLTEALEGLVQQRDDFQRQFPQRLKEIDLQQNRIISESALPEDPPDFQRIMDLIIWALPLLHGAIEEGTQVYNFVEEHIAIEEVGILPSYREEGYWFVPDLVAGLLHLLRYEVTLFTSSTEKYRALKTVLLESLPEGPMQRSPEAVKLQLLEKYRDLPNPATYRCSVDLDFPYAETMLPVAKRKLMAHLAA